MELREVLILLGILLIALIVWDGLRRMQQRKPAPRRKAVDLGPDPEEEKKKAELARELPNGGARVRDMTHEEREVISSKLNLRERVPMLMDSVDAEPEPDAAMPKPPIDKVEQRALDFERVPDLEAPSEIDKAATPGRDGVETDSPLSAKEDMDHWDSDWHFSAVDDEDRLAGTQADNLEKPVSQRREEIGEDDDEEAPDPKVSEQLEPPVGYGTAAYASSENSAADTSPVEPEPEPEPELPTEARTSGQAAGSTEDEFEYQEDSRPVEELVIIHVMARDKGEIAGGDLLELLLRAGLRFGPLDIFHYRNPQGQMEFSLANCVQPGTLNPDSMDQMATPGVTLFMQLPLRADMMTSFEHMYEMAVYLSNNLDATLLDEEHSTVTLQRVEHFRERLRNFSRAQLIQAH